MSADRRRDGAPPPPPPPPPVTVSRESDVGWDIVEVLTIAAAALFAAWLILRWGA